MALYTLSFYIQIFQVRFVISIEKAELALADLLMDYEWHGGKWERMLPNKTDSNPGRRLGEKHGHSTPKSDFFSNF